jgi:hypothetical protein
MLVDRRNALGMGLAVLTLLVLVGRAYAAEIPEALARKLAEFKGTERGRITEVTGDSLARALPGDRFYVLRFRQYPSALKPPEPLHANTLFVVKPDGSVDFIPDTKVLEGFFRAAVEPARTDTEAKETVKAWLRLTQEFHQDGFLRFSIPDEAFHATATSEGGKQVTGKAVVEPQGGNRGEITAALRFDPAGKVTAAAETADIKRGIRPICQATKLLDADPIVRGMAEQDILVMGRSAGEYLDARRAKAGPELRQAIDRIWQQILTEGR